MQSSIGDDITKWNYLLQSRLNLITKLGILSEICIF